MATFTSQNLGIAKSILPDRSAVGSMITIAGHEAKQTAQRLLAVRRNFTITSWLKTQFRRDTVRLDANIAALRVAGLPMGLSTLSLPKLARRVT
jgi:hypothetical protein